VSPGAGGGPPTGLAFAVLPPVLESVARARLLVADTASRWGLAGLREDASLVASELATNAVLHGRTAFRVSVRSRPSGMRIEVWDASDDPVVAPIDPPGPGGAGTLLDEPDDRLDVEPLLTSGITGRGLALVQAVAAAWGVDEGREGGKTVWAELGARSPFGPMPPAARPVAAPPRASGGQRTARLVAVPVDLVLGSEQHLSDVLRELQVMCMGGAGGPDDRPVAALRELLEHRAPWRTAMEEASRQAVARGDQLVDVTLRLTAAAVAWLEAVDRAGAALLDTSRGAAVVSLAPAPQVAAFRRWWAQEVSAQLAGRAPRACPLPGGGWGPMQPGDGGDTGGGGWAADGGPVAGPDADAERAALNARRQVELADLARRLDHVSGAGEVAAAVLERLLVTVGATAASLCLLGPDHETVEVTHAVGQPDERATRPRAFQLSAAHPACEAIRTGRTVAVRTGAERDGRFPDLSDDAMAAGNALACTPLLGTAGAGGAGGAAGAAGSVRSGVGAVGALVISFPRARDFTQGDVEFLEAISSVMAQALGSARAATNG